MRSQTCLALLLLLGIFFIPGVQAVQPSNADDPYAWLEDVHGTRPLAWVAQQNAKSLGVLKADRRYQANYDSILSVLDATDRIPYAAFRPDGLVYNFWQDAANPKGIWRRTTATDYQTPAPHWEILLDVDALAKAERENWVWEGSDCAPDRKPYCLISLSRGGGDAKVVREFDLKSKRFLPDGFMLRHAKSDAAYIDDDHILFGTDFGPGSQTASGYPRIVKQWTRGRAIADAPVMLEGKPEDVAVSPAVLHAPGIDLPIIARAVSFFESEYYLPGTDGAWRKLPLPLSADLKGLHDKHLLFTLRENWTPPGSAGAIAKGALIAVPIEELGLDSGMRIAVLFAPGPRQSIESVAAGGDGVYVSIYDNVVGKVHVFRHAAGLWSDKTLALPDNGSPDISAVDDFGPRAMFGFQNYLTPPTLYFDQGDDAPQAIKSLPARFEASGLVTEQFEAVSKDGTKIPYFVTRPKKLVRPAPAILYGYGGFEVSLTPAYSANFGRLWLSHGGIYVVANIRGGGEFGPAWHDAALKTDRQRAFDDFAAVATDLKKRDLTTAKQLGIMGGSNGGLLVSTVMVQHPELFGAVVCQVPLIDMLSYTHIGAGASWAGEYGDPADPKLRDYILSYSPYQNVKPGVKYPPILFVTATSDDRVTPVHARKMAAKMEAQGHEVLFYENTDGGHAAAADHKQAAEMWALSFVYLAEKLGLSSNAIAQ